MILRTLSYVCYHNVLLSIYFLQKLKCMARPLVVLQCEYALLYRATTVNDDECPRHKRAFVAHQKVDPIGNFFRGPLPFQ